MALWMAFSQESVANANRLAPVAKRGVQITSSIMIPSAKMVADGAFELFLAGDLLFAARNRFHSMLLFRSFFCECCESCTSIGSRGD
jgi:hypothetical protein